MASALAAAPLRTLVKPLRSTWEDIEHLGGHVVQRITDGDADQWSAVLFVHDAKRGATAKEQAAHLAASVGAPVYRLAVDFDLPDAVDIAERAYRGLLGRGFAPHDVRIAGEDGDIRLLPELAGRLRAAAIPQHVLMVMNASDPTGLVAHAAERMRGLGRALRLASA